MAMTPEGLKDALKQGIEGVPDFPTDGQQPSVPDDRMLLALATAIVEYIQDNATVSVVGVQPGGGTASGSIQ